VPPFATPLCTVLKISVEIQFINYIQKSKKQQALSEGNVVLENE